MWQQQGRGRGGRRRIVHRWERRGQLRIITISCPFLSLLHIDIRPMFRTHGNHLSSPCCTRPRIYYLHPHLRLFPMPHEHVLLVLLAQLLVLLVPELPSQLDPRRDRQVLHRVRRVLRPLSVTQRLRKVLAGYHLFRLVGPVLEQRQPIRHVLEFPLGRVRFRRLPKIGQIVLFHHPPPHEKIEPSVSKEQNAPGKKGEKGEMEKSIRKRVPSKTPMTAGGGK